MSTLIFSACYIMYQRNLAYGSGYLLRPDRSICGFSPLESSFVVPLTSLMASDPVLSSMRLGPKAFSFASSKILVPLSL